MSARDLVRGRSVPPLVATVFGVVVDLRTYRSLAYLFLAFPLGIAYFTVLVTVVSAVAGGFPFTVVLAPLLLLAVHGLAWVERGVVVYVLGVEVRTEDRPLSWLRAAVREPPTARTFARQASALAKAPRTWTRSLLVAAKFPVGIGLFVGLVVLGTVTGVMIAAPLLYDLPGTSMQVLRPVVTVVTPAVERAGVSVGATPTLAVSGTVTEVETLPGALATSAGGVVLGIASLHLLNAVAQASAWVTVALVGCRRPG
jgi:hypothetical protein